MSLKTVLSRVLSKRSEPAYVPERYWEQRHQEFRDSFKAVAHMCLEENTNAEQYDVKRSHVENMIRRFVPEPAGRTLLDAGCGIGLLTPFYAEMGFQVTAVDISPTALERARATGAQADFLVSALSALSLQRRFDVIVAVDVLLHIVEEREWRLSLASLAGHLAPRGVLIILDWLPGPVPLEANYFAARSLGQCAGAFESIGLEITDHEQFVLEHEGATKDLLAVQHRQD